MAAGAGSQQSLRKALKTVGIAKANGNFKVLDIAISKVTKHSEALPKEKYVLTILHAVSASRPRAEVAYCIHGLANRLSKANTWKVALKIVIVLHRALREVDDSFCDALIKCSLSRGRILNINHSWDETRASAWSYSSWIRLYASYLEERLECFRVLKYDVQKDHLRTKELETSDLLRQLPALQQLLSRLLDCQLDVGTLYNGLIQYSISMVASESAKLYAAITDGIVNLVDKFFEMQRDDAIKALEIYKKSGIQAERLFEFFEICRSLNFGWAVEMIKIQQPPGSFLATMEDYVKDASGVVTFQLPLVDNGQTDATNESISVNGDLLSNEQVDTVEQNPSVGGTETATSQVVDLLSFDEVIPITSKSDENNLSTPTIVQSKNMPDLITGGFNSTHSNSSWEIELFTPGTSDGDVTTQTLHVSGVVENSRTKLAGGLDRLTLNSLYDNAMPMTPYQSNNNNIIISYPPVALAPPPSNPFEDHVTSPYQFQHPFYASTNETLPINQQMTIMSQQHQYFMMMQQMPQLQSPSIPNMGQNLPNFGQNSSIPYQNLPSPCQNPLTSGNPFSEQVSNPLPSSLNYGLI